MHMPHPLQPLPIIPLCPCKHSNGALLAAAIGLHAGLSWGGRHYRCHGTAPLVSMERTHGFSLGGRHLGAAGRPGRVEFHNALSPARAAAQGSGSTCAHRSQGGMHTSRLELSPTRTQGGYEDQTLTDSRLLGCDPEH
jgi:hypothetical protein